jgi:hypothetical protein
MAFRSLLVFSRFFFFSLFSVIAIIWVRKLVNVIPAFRAAVFLFLFAMTTRYTTEIKKF